MIASGHLFAPVAARAAGEAFEDLLSLPGVRIERIVSTGQATPAGQWLEQAWTEWVALLSGAAGLRFEGEARTRVLGPGDWVNIPPGVRHRVEWTLAGSPSVWLAIHAGEPPR